MNSQEVSYATKMLIPSDGIQAINLLLDDIKRVLKQQYISLSDECDYNNDALTNQLCFSCKDMVYKEMRQIAFFDKIQKQAKLLEQHVKDLETIICETKPFLEKILWLNNQSIQNDYQDSRDSKIYKQKILKFVDSSFEAQQLYDKNELINNLNDLRVENEKKFKQQIIVLKFKNQMKQILFENYQKKQQNQVSQLEIELKKLLIQKNALRIFILNRSRGL